MALSRRQFGKAVIAGVPLATVFAAMPARAAAETVAVGATTTSFRDLPRVTGRDNLDAVIRALQAVRVTHIELALATLEPAPPSTAPFRGGTPAYPKLIVLTPEEVAATNAAYRAELRTWRLKTPMAFFEAARDKFAAAGIRVHACSLGYDESFTDDEIDATLRQVKALGVAIVSSPMSMATAARLAPFADRHGVLLAIHNQVDGNAAGLIGTAELDKALAISAAFRLALDAGNLTAANCDAVSELRAHEPRVSHVIIKDRLRNGGASQPFGEGDTPIADLVKAISVSSAHIPAFVEYDYAGLRPSVDELGAAVAYVERSLATASR